MSNNKIDSDVYDFGYRLKQLRKDIGLTQKEVANFLDVNQNTIGRYENNTQTPPLNKLYKLAVLYHSSIDYIMGLTDRTNIYIDDLPPHKQETILEIVKTIRDEYEKENKNG